jgi:hypothetical protein
VKKLLRSAVLTLICAGMLSVVAMPKTISPVSTNLSPIPQCGDDGCYPR